MTGYEVNGGGRGGNIWRAAAWSLAALVLPANWIAMQFTDEVNWTLSDFVFAGVLIFGTGIVFELAVRMSRNAAYRAAAGLALAAAFLLIWINAAVGIIGSEDNNANLMYGGVLAVGTIGALIARFQPLGMARALFAAACAHVAAGVIALAGGLGSTSANWPFDVLGLTAFFAALFIASALLFQRAAEQQSA